MMPVKKQPVKKLSGANHVIQSQNSIGQLTAPDTRIVPINSVKLWKENPRKNADAVVPLSKILSKHGQKSAIIVWKKNNVIYKGNTTWKAMKLLGATNIKVQYEDFPSETAAVAYGVADNKSSEFAGWDDELLTELMGAEEFDKTWIESMGFDDEEIQGLLMEADMDKIDKLQNTDTGIRATVKIQCNPEDRDEIRDLLKSWASESGFKEVVIK